MGATSTANPEPGSVRLSNRISNKSAAETGLQLLIAGGARHAHPGPKIGESWADHVPEMRLACYREPRQKVVLDAARGVIICQEGRNRGWSESLQLSQGDREFRQRRLIPLPGHLEHEY